MSDKKVSAVILAAGTGTRMGASKPKQYLEIGGISVLRRCVMAFFECDIIDSIVVVVPENDKLLVENELADLISKPLTVVEGASTRAGSARLGVKATPENTDFVAIHDGARCLVTPAMIRAVVDEARLYGAATAGYYSTDTVKQTKCGIITKTIERSGVFLASTPQVFEKSVYTAAVEKSQCGEDNTDDNMIMEKYGVSVHCVDVGKNNIKITLPEDILYAEFLISERKKESDAG